MKHNIFILTCLLLPLSLMAQQKKKAAVLAEVAAFSNLNKGDIDAYKSAANFSQKSTIGGYAGLMLQIAPEGIFSFKNSLGLHVNPQHFQLTADDFNLDVTNTNVSLYWKIMIGCNLKIDPDNRIFIDLGLMNLLSLKNESYNNQFFAPPYTDPQTGETWNKLRGIYKLNWGDNRQDRYAPFIYNFIFRMGYENTSLLKRRCGVALEMTTRLGSGDSNDYGNSMSYAALDANRNITGTYRIIDRYASIGVDFFVTIH